MYNTRRKPLVLAVAALGPLLTALPASGGVTLYGITGDGSFTPTTLFTIDTATGAATPVLALENPGAFPDGEGIAFNAHDGLLYRTSGLRPGSQVFQAIDPDALTVGPNLAAGATYGPDAPSEVFGIVWYEPLGVFLVTSLNFRLYHVTPEGGFTEAGVVGEWMRGLAVVGERVFGVGPRSVVGFHEKIWEIDPHTGAVLDELDLTINGQAAWGTALTTHPVTGEVFGSIINPQDRGGPRLLATVDVTTGVATEIGNTGERFAGLTFVVTQDPVTFESTAQDIADGLAAGLIDNSGIAQSLLAKLEAAAEAAARDQPGTAIQILAAFALELQAQSGKRLSPEMATILQEDAAALIAALGG